MVIPPAQGVIRTAYTHDYGDDEEEQLRFGTVFAAVILHIVHACNPEDAAVIQENMTFDTNSPNFAVVKTASENNYECMNIDCTDVAGLVDDDGEYLKG